MDVGPRRSDSPRPRSGRGEDASSVQVCLEVPAEPRFARVVRVAVAAVAVRRGLDVAVIEDLRISTDESLILLLRGATEDPDDGATAPAEHSVVLTIDDGTDDLVLDLQLRPPATGRSDAPDDLDALSRFAELVPSRVAVRTVDLATGHVRLGLA